MKRDDSMTRCNVVILSIVSGLLLLLSTFPTSAEMNDTNVTDPVNTTSSYKETQLLDQEVSLNLNFLTSMLQILDLNLKLTNETLNSHLKEYPFLKPTLEGTDEGIKRVDSIIFVLGSNPENLSDNVTPSSLNESLAQINSSLQYPDAMIEDANSTMEESNITTPMIRDMYKSVKTMTTLINQF